MEDIDVKWLALAGLVGLGAYYCVRANRVMEVAKASTGPGKTVYSQPEANQLKMSSKFPFTTMSKRIGDPSVYSVTEGTYAREGEFGLERRDHHDPWGTATITHTDNFNNF